MTPRLKMPSHLERSAFDLAPLAYQLAGDFDDAFFTVAFFGPLTNLGLGFALGILAGEIS